MSKLPPDDAHECVTPTPAALSGASLNELLTAWHGHIGALVDARHGIGTPRPGARLRVHALDAIATGQALVDAVNASRWTNALDALTHGATVDELAAAAGLDADEVTLGMRAWADEQLANHEGTGGAIGIGPDAHAVVYAALTDEQDPTGGC